MAETTDQLMNDARCIDKCIPDGMKLAVLISIFQQILTNGTGGTGSGNLSGIGSPVGVKNATSIGQFYTDYTNPAVPLIWVATATGTGGWQQIIN